MSTSPSTPPLRPNDRNAPGNPPGRGFFGKVLVGLVVVVLVALGLYITLFILGNSSWAVVRIPALPQDILYESQVWAIILISFGIGLALSWVHGAVGRWVLRRRRVQLDRRIEELEREVERLGKLAMAAQKDVRSSDGTIG